MRLPMHLLMKSSKIYKRKDEALSLRLHPRQPIMVDDFDYIKIVGV